MATLYHKLFGAYRKLYQNDLSKSKVQDTVNKMLSAFKEDKDRFPGNAEKKK